LPDFRREQRTNDKGPTVSDRRMRSLPPIEAAPAPARPRPSASPGAGRGRYADFFAASALDSRHARHISQTMGRTERMMIARITSLKFFWTKGWLPNQ